MSNWTPLLHGIGFTGYRSFGDVAEPILMDGKVTVLAGQNNSGKSNVLRYVQRVLPTIGDPQQTQVVLPDFTDVDVPSGIANEAGHSLSFAIPWSDVTDPTVRRSGIKADQERVLGALRKIRGDDTHVWLRIARANGEHRIPLPEKGELTTALGWHVNFQSVLSNLGGGTVDADNVLHRLLMTVFQYVSIPPIATIESARRVEAITNPTIDVNAAESGWLAGRGIIERLAPLQNPDHGTWRDARPRWESINRFVQTVLGDREARVNIPDHRNYFQVETANRVLPLSNWGSGTEQVVILAAAATLLSKTLVCLEEPETNLHPILQKKLIDYLLTETSNQYLIATHSSHLLDSSRVGSYHLRMTPAGTVTQRARKPHELVQIFNDLGYRPSDIMQANCVIWVEGPSDRIYLRAWLKLLAPDLTESLHFSIMFYGGALLSHLSVDEEALEDFIQLRRLNRHSAVVLDSDKTSPRKKLRPSAQRIKDEFENDDAPGLAWVTRCYTIENYVPRDKLRRAVETVHPTKALRSDSEQWANPLPDSPDKIAIARAAIADLAPDDLARFALRKDIEALVRFIRDANAPVDGT